MSDIGVAIFLLFSCLLFLPDLSSSYPLCTDSRTPFTSKAPLGFCSYNGSVCCDSAQDSELQKQFKLMNVSDIACASVLKSIICASCDPFSAELFKIESGLRTVPVLCNSSASVNSAKSNSEANGFCSKVWDACQNVSILNSPFAPTLQGRTGLPDDSTSSKLTAPSLQGRAGVPGNSTLSNLTDLWQSKTDFCKAFAGSSTEGSVCFDGEPVTLKKSEISQSPKGMCLEKIGNGSYLNMVPHPDGSNRVFFSNQEGKIWLATVPDEESGGTLGLDVSSPFVDLTDEVHFDTLFGIMGMAFHPDYARNGRFFVSFNCDKEQSSQCSGRCSCNSDANCDPSKLITDDDSQPCRYHSVIAEYTANGTASSQVSLASVANPSEVRRIFTMGLPSTGHHAGQILFGPADGYLYFMMGDGGGKGDPYNFSQNKKSLLGKIMRLDIDNIPSAKEIDDLGLWGNYSIPKDNPSFDDKELQPEVWALGMRNPWRCSFDSERPSYFLCADVGQEQYEEVDIITKGGNYGWRVYEGDTLNNPTQSTTGNMSSSSSNFIFPILGYNHSDVNKNEGSASITGGYFYRSMTDPCMYGRYLYADLYATALWAAEENPKNSGNFTATEIPFSCAHDTPIQCASISGSSLPSLGYIYSFGEDNKKNIFLLTSTGVYRVVRPSRCNYTCSAETPTTKVNPSTTRSSPSSGNRLSNLQKELVFLFSTCLLLFLSLI